MSLKDKLRRFGKKYGNELAAGGVSVLTGQNSVGGVLNSIFGPPAPPPPTVPSGDTGNNAGFIGPPTESSGPPWLLIAGGALALYLVLRK